MIDLKLRTETNLEFSAFICFVQNIRTGQNLNRRNSRQLYQPIGSQNIFGMQSSGMQIINLVALSGSIYFGTPDFYGVQVPHQADPNKFCGTDAARIA
jgi:hypothetical protein